MRIFLLRHGEAGYNAVSDRLRPLTEKGKRELDEMLLAFTHAQQVSQVYHSPYLRTCQTAERLNAVQPDLNFTASDLLVPESSPQSVVDWLAKLSVESDIDRIMLVTHQPLIGYLSCLLTEGNVNSPEPLLPGYLAELEMDVPAAGLARLIKVWHAN